MCCSSIENEVSARQRYKHCTYIGFRACLESCDDQNNYLLCFYLSSTHNNQPPTHTPPSYNYSNTLTNSGVYHETMDVGFMLFVHHPDTHQCAVFYIYFTHCWRSYLCGSCKNAVCITGHTVSTEVLTLHLIGWLKKAMKPSYSVYPVSWWRFETHTLWLQI
jgi:hypothetical protein